MNLGWRVQVARILHVLSMVLSLIFISAMITGFHQFYKATHGGPLPTEILNQLKAQGIPTENGRLEGAFQRDFAGGRVVHVTPVSLIVFLPIALIFGAYFILPTTVNSWLGRSAIVLASMTFLGEVGVLFLIFYMPA